MATWVVIVAGFKTTEIQLPGGTWINCRGDCYIAFRDRSTLYDRLKLTFRWLEESQNSNDFFRRAAHVLRMNF